MNTARQGRSSSAGTRGHAAHRTGGASIHPIAVNRPAGIAAEEASSCQRSSNDWTGSANANVPHDSRRALPDSTLVDDLRSLPEARTTGERFPPVQPYRLPHLRFVQRRRAKARRQLRRTKARLAGTSVALLYSSSSTGRRSKYDDFKWRCLPDTEARVAVPAAEEEIDKQIKEGVGEPFSRALRSITSASYSARFRRQRQTALFRAIEALRMYAAMHGQLPDKLQNVKLVPIPRDPYTDKPFEYSGGGGVWPGFPPPTTRPGPRAPAQSRTNLSCDVRSRRMQRRGNGRAGKNSHLYAAPPNPPGYSGV